MKKLLALAGLLAALTASPAWAAFDYFLKIDGIDGESADDKHAKWIDIDNWAWGLSNTLGSSGSGGAASKTVFDDFSWQQGVDASIVPLFMGVATGKHYAKATLDVVKPGENQEVFFQMVFTDVVLSKLQQQGSAESLVASGALRYDSVQLRYRDLQARGRAQRGRLVGSLPGELRLFAAEVAVGGGLLVDRTQQVEHLDDALRTQVEVLGHQRRQLVVAITPVPSV
jgi:type VI secretion system secreted protein Hcp